MRRGGLSVFGCVWLLVSACTLIHAQTADPPARGESPFPVPIDLSASQSTAGAAAGSLFRPESIAVLQNAPSQLKVDQVAVLPASAFALFDPNKTYALSNTKVLWLHFSAIESASSASLNWTFELPKPFVNRVELYHRNALGAWDVQQAGDGLPQAQWTARGLHPRFQLPQLNPGSNDFYVRVSQLIPLRFDVSLTTTASANFREQNALLANGILLGLMLFVSVFALVLAVAYRNKIYAWYGAYVLSALLALASYVGVAFFAFWPKATWLPEVAHHTFLMVAFATQLEFGRVLFVNPRASPCVSRVVWVTALAIAASAGYQWFTPQLDINWRLNALLACLVVGGLLMLAVVLKAAVEGRPMAWLWMLAYTPVIAVLGLTVVEQLGFAPVRWLPYNAIGLAVGFEVMLLLIALHLHVKSNHEWDVRQATVVELDPLTGFLAPLYFPDTLAQLWSETRHMRQDLAVAYVRADIDLRGSRSAVKISDDELVLRCVRMLRMVTRADDTVARIGGNVFAILMPRMSAGSNFAGKLSRLVALGVMRDTDDLSQQIVRFRIAATTFGSFSGTSKQLDEALKQKLNSLTEASERTIEFVRG